LYDLGTGLGLAASLALNPAGAGSALAKGAAGVYSVAGMTYGALESAGNILKGEGSAWDALNFIPALQLARASKGSRTVSSAIVEADAAVTQVAKKTECFVAGTEIQTLDGTKNIEDIHVGDWVLSDDPNTVGEIEYKQVLNTFVKETTNLVDIYIDGEKITTTEEHPFWVPDVGWVAAKDLHAGSLLQTKYESWLDVDKVVKHSDTATVYNFEVEGFHTYFVSDLGLLVHNTCRLDSLYGELRDPIPNSKSYQQGQPYAGIKDFEIGSNGKVIVNPELQIIKPGGQATPLERGKKYLWVIDEAGDLRIGVEAPVIPGSPNALGHPTLVEGGKARAGGEIQYDNGWFVNDNSGRYSKGRTREIGNAILDNAHRLMENAGLTGLRKEYR
jgi:Pretoxin HINT domain